MSLTAHEASVLGTLDALRESIEGLASTIRRRAFARSGVLTLKDADTRRVELLPTNRFRHQAVIVNDSTAVMFLALGSDAATDLYTYKLQAADTVETPAGYIGPITAVWSAVNGQARITELS